MKKRIFAFFLAGLLAASIPGTWYPAAAKTTAVKPMVSCSSMVTGFLTPGGTLLMVGNNELGQIGNGECGDGDGETDDKIVLTPYAAMEDVRYISIENHSCYAIKKDNTLWSWGDDICEALGNGDGYNSCSFPTQIMDDVKFVATGHALHMLAIKEDNTLWAWGQNDCNQVKAGLDKYVPSPVQIMSGVKYAAVGYGTSAVIKEDDSLWMWGVNNHGQLGNGTENDSPKPKKVMDNVKMVICGFYRTCVLKKDGTVWAFGQNDHGEIGDGTLTERHKPTQVKGLTNVVSISSKGMNHMLALKKDGTVWAWGNNEHGQIGDGNTADRLTPVKVLTNAQYVESSDGSSFAIRKDNTVWSWGLNNAGQLGTLNQNSTKKPVKVLDFNKMKEGVSYTYPELFIDGSMEDWEDPEPTGEDSPDDSLSKKAELKSVYSFMDKKNLYLAIETDGNNPDISVYFDNDEDGKEEYQISFSNGSTYVWTYKAKSNGDWTEGPMPSTCNYRDGLYELMIPLSDIGSPRRTSIRTCIFASDVDGICDQTDGWEEVPIILE